PIGRDLLDFQNALTSKRASSTNRASHPRGTRVKESVLALSLAAVACGGGSSAPAPVAAPIEAQENGPGADKEAWAKSQGLELKKFDLNRDGEPDIFKYYRMVDDPKNAGNKLEQMVRKEIDINHDGKIDV